MHGKVNYTRRVLVMGRNNIYMAIILVLMLFLVSFGCRNVGPAGAFLDGAIDNLRSEGVLERPTSVLIVDVVGNGQVYVSQELYNEDFIEYQRGTEITLTAFPNEGSEFSRWEDSNGSVLSTDTSMNVVMDRDRTIRAVFEASPSLNIYWPDAGSLYQYVPDDPSSTLIYGITNLDGFSNYLIQSINLTHDMGQYEDGLWHWQEVINSMNFHWKAEKVNGDLKWRLYIDDTFIMEVISTELDGSKGDILEFVWEEGVLSLGGNWEKISDNEGTLELITLPGSEFNVRLDSDWEFMIDKIEYNIQEVATSINIEGDFRSSQTDDFEKRVFSAFWNPQGQGEWSLTTVDGCSLYDSIWPPKFHGGAGTQSDPYRVATAEHLDNIRDHLDKHFIQVADIDLGDPLWSQGEGWEPIGDLSDPFTGTYLGMYEGNQYKIKNLYIDRSSEYQGLFGFVRGATIKHMQLLDISITGGSFTGGVAGYSREFSYEDISVSGTIQGASPTGGITGLAEYGGITNTHSSADVNGGARTGGLVGYIYNSSTISYSSSTGNVSGGQDVGGLVGQISSGTINQSYSSGNVNATDMNSGGLVGTGGNINNSYSLSNVNGTTRVGGLLGSNGSITNSYAIGEVSGSSDLGGLIGWGHHGSSSATNSYWNTQTTNRNTSVGGGEGKITAEMIQQTTYENWDFADVWNIDEGQSYPYLIWQQDTSHNYPEDIYLFEEDFQSVDVGDIPDGWSRTHENWAVSNSDNAGGSSPEMRFNWTPSDTAVFMLITPTIDASFHNGLTLEFNQSVHDWAMGYTLKVQTSTDDGNTWNTVWTFDMVQFVDPETITIDLGHLDGETFKIAWVFDGDSFNINQWYIDDIRMESF